MHPPKWIIFLHLSQIECFLYTSQLNYFFKQISKLFRWKNNDNHPKRFTMSMMSLNFHGKLISQTPSKWLVVMWRPWWENMVASIKSPQENGIWVNILYFYTIQTPKCACQVGNEYCWGWFQWKPAKIANFDRMGTWKYRLTKWTHTILHHNAKVLMGLIKR